jgi:hypothetical protein
VLKALRLTSRDVLVLVVLLALILVTRFVWLGVMEPYPVRSDASGYDAAARRLMLTGTFAFPIGSDLWANDVFREDAWDTYKAIPPNAFSMPGYPAFLAGVYSLSGSGDSRFAAVRIVQVIVSLIGIAALFVIVRVIAGKPQAWTAVVLAALYPPNLWANEYLLTEVLFTTLLLLQVLSMLVAARYRTWLNFAIVGIATVVTAYVRPTALLLPALLAGYLIFSLSKRREWRTDGVKIALRLGVTGLLIVALMAPWVVRNQRIYNEFVPLTSASSLASLITVTGAFGLPMPRGILAQDMERDKFENEREIAKWATEAQARLKSQAGPAGVTNLRRFRAFVMTRSWLSPFTFFSQVTWWPDPRFMMQVVLLLLALAGVIAKRRSPEMWFFLLGVPVYFTIVHMLTYVQSRYLYPGMQFVLALAAIGIVWLARPVIERVRNR